MESSAVYRLFGGSKGPGKSYALIWEAIRTCLRIPKCNVLCLRRTYPELRKGLLRHFEMYVPNQIYGGLKNYNKSDKVVKFPNGSNLFFGVAQHEKDILDFNGHEYVAIFIDESTEFTFFMFQFLCAQLRCPIANDIYGEPVVPFMALGTNPIGVGHEWHKALFVGDLQPDGTYLRNLKTVQKVLPEVDEYDPSEYDYIPAVLDDNLTYAAGTKLGIDYRKKLDKLPEFLKDAYIKGSWETNTGRYFTRFDPEEVKIDRFICEKLVRHQRWHPKWIGIDWGYNDYTTVFWASQVTLNDEDGDKRDVTVIYREHVVRMTDSADLADQIATLSTYTDENGNPVLEKIEAIYISPDAKENRGHQFTIMQRLGDALVGSGLPYPLEADDDRKGGARLLDEMMSSTVELAGNKVLQPELRISDECEQLLFAIPRLMRNPKEPNDVLKVKKEGDPTDDIYDGWRYTLKSKLAAGDVPYAVQRQRILDACATNQERFFTDMSLKQMKRSGGTITFSRPRFSRSGARR